MHCAMHEILWCVYFFNNGHKSRQPFVDFTISIIIVEAASLGLSSIYSVRNVPKIFSLDFPTNAMLPVSFFFARQKTSRLAYSL